MVSSKNINELAGIVKLASSFKHIDSVFVQPIILHESLSGLSDLLLDTVDITELERRICEAEEMSKRVGVRLDGLDLIKSEISKKAESWSNKQDIDVTNAKYCRYMWNGIISLNRNGRLRYLCCYMEKGRGEELIKRYNLPLEGRMEVIYNSKEMWKLRTDMLNGKLIEYCRNCNLCNAGYENMKNKKLQLEEYFYV